MLDNGKTNYWLAEEGETTKQGFTLKVDSCGARWISGIQLKNKGKGSQPGWATRGFKVSGANNSNGPWQTLLEEELVDTRGKAASLLNFTFDEAVEVLYLKFALVSYWGNFGGGLQYFAPIPATSEHHLSVHDQTFKKGGSVAETTSDSSITTSTVEATGQRQQKFESYWVAWKVKCILNH